MTAHRYQDLITIFHDCFFAKYNTKLVKGGDEPIYLPQCAAYPYHRIIFAHGFFMSALHEISHWCIAGEARRELEDYGYWYCPDGRDEATQSAFEALEILPQSLDWLFCVATDHTFNVSADNLNGSFEPDRDVFKKRAYENIVGLLKSGSMPPRAKIFLAALQLFYGKKAITIDDFC